MILSLGFIAFVTLLHIVGKVSHDLCISQRWTQLMVSIATGLMHMTVTVLLHCVAAARELIIWAGHI